MYKYECKICNFNTNDRGNWFRHNKTNKHLKLAQKFKIKCLFCDNYYENEEKVKEHYFTCQKNVEVQNLMKEKIEMEKDKKIELLQQQNESLQQQKEILEKHIVEMHDDKKFSNSIAMSSLSALKYLNANHPNAPALKPFDDYQFICYDEDDIDDSEEEEKFITEQKERYIEGLFALKRKSRLQKYIGNNIVTKYKKINPAEQSSWSVDVSRLNYIVKTDKWTRDAEGVIMCQNMVDPILQQIRDLLIEYKDNKCKKEYKTPQDIQNCITAQEIIMSIDNKELGHSINKYIAPQFQLKIK